MVFRSKASLVATMTALSFHLVPGNALADGPLRQEQDPSQFAFSVDGLAGTGGEGALLGIKGSSTRSDDPTFKAGYAFDLKAGVVELPSPPKDRGGTFVGNIGGVLSPTKINLMIGDPMIIHSDGSHFFAGLSPLVALGYGHVTGTGMYYIAPKVGFAGTTLSQGPGDGGLLLGGEGVYEKDIDLNTTVRLAAILGAVVRGGAAGATYSFQASASRRIKPYLGVSAGVEVSDVVLPNVDGSNTSSVSALGTLGLVLETPR